MEFTKFTKSVNNVQSLPDKPALETEELKRVFDLAGIDIKDYINNILLNEVEEQISSINIKLTNLVNTSLKDNSTNLRDTFLKIYHVGKIIIETSNINPETYLGFGKWERFGKGRVLVSVDESDKDFNNVEKSGGEKTHKLTVEEMPNHNHDSRVVKQSWTQINNKNAYAAMPRGTTEDGANYGWSKYESGYNCANQATGGSKTHNNMQPYITCYMWKRIS